MLDAPRLRFHSCSALRRRALRAPQAFSSVALLPLRRCGGSPKALSSSSAAPHADADRRLHASQHRQLSSRGVTLLRAAADGAAVEEGTPGEEQTLWTPADLYEEGAARLRALMEALPELTEVEEPSAAQQEGGGGGGSGLAGRGGVPALAALLDSTPALVEVEPEVLRGALESLASALGVSLVRAARLAARVPALWEGSPEGAAEKVAGLAAELGVGTEAALDLYGSQPGLWAVSQPSIIKDRLDTLATRLGVPLRTMVDLVGRQAILWVVPPPEVASSLGEIGGRLGLGDAEAAELVARVPPLLALDPKLMRLSVQGVCSSTGVSAPALIRLLARSLGLVAVPTELLAGSLEALAADLGCGPEDVVELMISQPTLLCAQYNHIKAGLEALEAALRLDRPAALRLLAAQPGLMYDTSAETIAGRLDGLAATFRLPGGAAEAAALAAAAPALLAVAPATVRSAVSAVAAATGGSMADVLDLARSDPGELLMTTLQDSQLSAWTSRLELPAEDCRALLCAQPGLLELTPTTVKARLESLAALFGVPRPLAAALLLKHGALGAVPPNATITRAKNISTALQVSLQSAASIVAKSPAFLAVLAHCSGQLAGGSVPEDVGEVGAAYEYFTMEWLQRQVREMQPGRVTSFSQMDS